MKHISLKAYLLVQSKQPTALLLQPTALPLKHNELRQMNKFGFAGEWCNILGNVQNSKSTVMDWQLRKNSY